MKKLNIITSNPEETRVLAIKFSASLKSGDVILLHGNLGAGKTTFVKGLINCFAMYIIVCFYFFGPLLKETRKKKQIFITSYIISFILFLKALYCSSST